jgi:hypothetical protein
VSRSSAVTELIAMKVLRIERGRGIVADVSDILNACKVGCKTVRNLGHSQSTKEENFLL